MKNRKKIKSNKKVKKAFWGAAIGAGTSLITGLIGQAKEKKALEKANIQANLLSKQNNLAQEEIRLEDFKQEGEDILSYYATGGVIEDDKTKKKTTTRPVTDEEANANSYKNSPDSMFTAEGIKQLGFVKETSHPDIKLDLGKYAKVGYFDTIIDPEGQVTLKNTSKNPANAELYNKQSKYIQKRNPNVNFARTGFTPLIEMEKGGKVTAPSYLSTGGNLKPISSDMEKVEGKTHAEGGVNLYDNNGNPIVEVEDDETIKDGKYVYSDKLKVSNGKTYADNASSLGRKKAKIETKTGNAITEFTKKRQLAAIDLEEDLLFAEQQTKNGNQTTTSPKAERGMNLDMPEDNFLTKAAPYLDNVANAFLTLKTPKIPKPVLEANIPLKTSYNVQPQLNDVTKAVESSAENIKNNTSNSAVARNAITKTRLAGSRQKAGINANKENVETQLHNQNVRHQQNITNQNLAKIDNYNTKNMMRSNDIQSRISNNVSNLSKDIIKERNFKAGQRYNKELTDIASNMYQSDTTRRALLSNPTELQYMRSNPEYGQQVLDRFKGTKEEEELRRLLGIPLVSSIGTINSKGYANI